MNYVEYHREKQGGSRKLLRGKLKVFAAKQLCVCLSKSVSVERVMVLVNHEIKMYFKNSL